MAPKDKPTALEEDTSSLAKRYKKGVSKNKCKWQIMGQSTRRQWKLNKILEGPMLDSV